jgi:hypothetical protein
MGKYSLGTATTKLNSNMSTDQLNLNTTKANPLEQDMEKQFDSIKSCLSNINTLLNKAVNKKVVKGSYATAFKGWARKCNSQATAAGNRKSALSTKYTEDVKNYTIKLLDSRIAALENKINSMSES